MRRLIAMLALAGALCGCETYYPGASPSPPPPAPPTPRRPPIDTCGAGALQYLVGRPVSDIPQSYGRHPQRVIGAGGTYEDRFDPERLTIVYNEADGRIIRVRCG